MSVRKTTKQKKGMIMENEMKQDVVAFATIFKGKKRTETFLVKKFGPDEFRTIQVAKEEYDGQRLVKKDVSNWETDKDSRKAVVKVVEDIEDNPGFFRVKLYAIPHFQVEGMDVNLSLVSQMPKAKS